MLLALVLIQNPHLLESDLKQNMYISKDIYLSINNKIPWYQGLLPRVPPGCFLAMLAGISAEWSDGGRMTSPCLHSRATELKTVASLAVDL